MAEPEIITGDENEPRGGPDLPALKSVGEAGGLGVLVKAEFDSAMLYAAQHPRNIDKARKTLMTLVLMDEETAKEAVYALPARRGSTDNKKIQGASIRFAEMVMSCWGNMRAASRVIEEGREFVTCQGVCIDLERNCHTSIEIPRRILTNKGVRYSTDMIQQTAGAASSIARRNAILGNVPRPFWLAAYRECLVAITGTPQTFRAKLDEVYRAFAKWNVTPEMLAEVLGYGKDPAKILIDDLVTLRGIYNAINTEDQTVDSIFNPEKARSGPDAGGYNPLRRGAAAAKEDEPRADTDQGQPQGQAPAAPATGGQGNVGGASEPGPATAGAQAPKASRKRKGPAGEQAPGGAPAEGGGQDREGVVPGRADDAAGGAKDGTAGMAADSPSAPAPAVDVLKELQDAVAEAKDEAALESVGSTFAPILQGKLSPEEEAFVEKLFMDRIGVLSGPKTVAKEEAWDAAAASKDILAAVAEAKDGSQLADVMKAILEGRKAIVEAGRGDLDMEITKAIEAKSASFAPKPAQAAPAAPDAGASPDAVLKLYDEYKPRDPSRLESWRKIVLEMAAAKTKADVETAYAPHRQTVTAWGDDSGNLAAIRFMIRKNLPE